MPKDCRIGWNSVVHNHIFILTVWFQREQCEALHSVAIVGHVFSRMMKSVAKNDIEAKI
jgi:hypothetical protein